MGDEYPEEWSDPDFYKEKSRHCAQLSKVKLRHNGIENKKTGHLYDAKEVIQYMMDIKHPFHNTIEEFEVYECPDCESHFLVECGTVESVSVIYCPYCRTPFHEKKDLK